MQQVAVLREPFFGYYRYFAIRQGKFFFSIKDMIFELDEGDAIGPEMYYGIYVEPIVIFFDLQVYLAAAKQVFLLPVGLLNLESCSDQLIMILVQPLKNR